MEILLASNNQHKRLEIEGILRDLGVPHTVVQPKEIGFSFDVVEDGESFSENAWKKAYALYALVRGELREGVDASIAAPRVAHLVRERYGEAIPPILADDSGICVDALGGKPGIYSARFGNQPDGAPLNDRERNALLLESLSGVDERAAHYVCNAIAMLDEGRYCQIQETWHGVIAPHEQAGDTGFGYDPIVLIPDYETTVARIPQTQKDRISHRAKAIGGVARALAWTGGA